MTEPGITSTWMCSFIHGPVCQSLPVNLSKDPRVQKQYRQPQNQFQKNKPQRVFRASVHSQPDHPELVLGRLDFSKSQPLPVFLKFPGDITD